MKTYLYRASNFSGLCFIEEVNFWRPPKTIVSCDLFIIIIIIINFFRRVLSECSLHHLSPIFLRFIIGFSCTVWTKMRSLTGSLADGVLADAILFLPRPPIYKEGKGSSKSTATSNRKNHLL